MPDPGARQIGPLGPDACYSTDKFGRLARGARRQNNGFSKIPDQASPPIVGGPPRPRPYELLSLVDHVALHVPYSVAG